VGINNGVLPVTVAGVLISDEKLYSYDVDNRGLRPIFKNNNSKLQFLVEPISSLPDSFPAVKYFHAYASYLEKFFDEFSYEYRERDEKLREFLQNKIIMFKPYRNGEYNNVDQYSFEFKNMPLEHTIDTRYLSIPIFKTGDMIFKKEDFEKRLIQKRFLGGKMGISKDINDVPEIVIWDDNENYTLYGVFDTFKYTTVGGFCFESKNAIKALLFDEIWGDSSIVCSGDSVMFISVLTYTKIIEKLKKEGAELCHDQIPEKQSDSFTSTAINKESISEVGSDIDIVNKGDEEKIFIERFIKQTQQDGFVYDYKDLVNFHIAMKSSNLVILAGMSGTGKSKLISLYGKSLGLTDEQLKIIPVRPSWTDDSDILGYLDTMNMIYRPADTGLVETLIAAQNKDNLYVVCFDEMNLSRVEHYFSQFLSVLEKENEKRYLQLYNSELENRVYNKDQYKSKIELGDNILFVGTVNLDESTYHFSDKVLDRANVINLKICPIKYLKKLSEMSGEKSNEKGIKLSFMDFNEFRQKNADFALKNREIDFLTELHNILHSESKNLGIGYRIVRQMDVYLKNIPSGDWISREEGFDLQVVQRIMTKIRGPEDQLQGLLGKIKDDSGMIFESKLKSLIDTYKDVSDFTETGKSIFNKARELKMYGYTI